MKFQQQDTCNFRADKHNVYPLFDYDSPTSALIWTQDSTTTVYLRSKIRYCEASPKVVSFKRASFQEGKILIQARGNFPELI